MKRFILYTRLIWALALFVIGSNLIAQDFKVDGIYYDILSGNEVEVCYNGNAHYSGDIVIPESIMVFDTYYKVTKIGDAAFRGYKDITSILIPNSVTEIGYQAFWGCHGLTSIVLPKIMERISASAFAGCTNLANIELPNNINSIGVSAFAMTPWFDSQEDGVVYIGNVAYKYKGEAPENTTVVIKDGTTSITSQAFQYCKNITSFDIPNSVVNIGVDAFDGTLWYANQSGSVIYAGNVAYKATSVALSSFELKNGTTGIADNAFHGCSKVTSIDLPNSIKHIGNNAFDYCTSMVSIEIPNSVVTIGDEAFSNCTRLTSVKLGDGITSMGDHVFWICEKLTSIEIPNSVTTIGEGCFENCIGLKSVHLPDKMKMLSNKVFSQCSSLTTIEIPNGLISLGNNAFSFCNSLTSIEIPNSVTSIGEGAFAYCSNLKTVVFPNSVTSIGDATFAGCALTDFKIPNGVTSIGYAAFEECHLKSIVIPKSITNVGRSAFRNNIYLTSVKSELRSPLNIPDDVFQGISSNAVLYVIKGIGLGSGWDKYFNNIVEYTIDYKLNLSAIGNGSISYNGTTIRGNSSSFSVTEGDNAEILITPDEGYRIKSVKLNGTDVTSSVSNNQYTISDINCDNTLEVVFEQITYSLTITSIGNGVVSYNDISIRGKTSSFTIPYGFSTNMTITPDTGYKIKSVLLNGKDITSSIVNNQYTISNITSDASIEVEFEQITYSLTIKATGYGTVTYAETTVRGKSSSFTISYGSNASLSIVPDDGYRIKSVNLNETDVTSTVKNNQYTITDITTNITIDVVFEQIPNYTISVISEGNGKVTFGSSIIRNQSKEFSIREGNSISISFTPDNGYRLASVKVNGENKTAQVMNNQLTLDNVSADMTIEVVFDVIPPTTYSLTIKATDNGNVTYNGTAIRGKSSSFTIVEGAYATITILPDDGYRIKCVKMNGTDVTSSVKNNAYSLKVEANTMIGVEFEAIPTYSLTIKSTGNGSATYNGTVVRGKSSSFTIVEGTDVVITFSPDTGYRIKSVKLNNTDVTSSVRNNQYTIDNINSNFTLEVEYEAIPPTTYSLTIKATGNGTAAYNGTAIRGKSNSFTVTEGTSAVVTFTPDTGYKVKSVVLNGTIITSNVINNQYTINAITAETSLEVVFERITYIFTIASTGNGTVTYEETAVRGKSSSFTLEEGTKVVVTFAPDNGYRLKSVMLNSKDVTGSVVNLQYTIANIDANTTLEVVFEAIPTYTINMVTAGNGSITYGSIVLRNQSREFSIREGGYISVKFTPDNGYRLASVKVNNQDMIGQVVNNQLIIEDIAADTNIEVAFEIIPITTYTFSIKSTGEGYVTYEGTIMRMQSKVFTVAEGTNAVVVITPDEGYCIKSVTLNGTDVTSSVVNYMYSTKIESNVTLEIEFMEDVMEFAIDNVNYKVVSYGDRTVRLASYDYGISLAVPATINSNNRQWTVIGIEIDALSSNQDLAAIIWNPEVTFNGNVSNPNLLLYVKDKKYGGMVKNVIVNGEADEIILTDAASGNNFYCPQTFTAKRITYEHNYSMKSGYNTCQGWETLALPFDVTQIHRQGGAELVPHSVWTAGSSQLPFWLYSLTELGWKKESSIAANTPYIICMPNNENYNNKYNISGVVQFIGTNVQVKASDNLNIGMKGNNKLVSNFQNQLADATIYALNVNNQWCQNTASEVEGSVFIQSLRPVRPFEAYLTVSGSEAARRVIPIFEEGESTGIINLPLRDDIIVDTWFTLDGRKLFSKPTEKGVYINKGKKVLVK